MVRPISYKVDSAETRYQKGSYGLMVKHERYEYRFMNNLVEEISVQLLNQTYLNVAKYPVGIESRVQDIYQLLSIGTTGRCVAGLQEYGELLELEKRQLRKLFIIQLAKGFKVDVSWKMLERSHCQMKAYSIYKRLLSETLGGTNLKVNNVHKGMNFIKQRLSHKRVLLILDDVHELDWSSNLAGATDYHQALELFSWHVFDTNEPPVEYVALARRAIDYVECLPLALKVFGTYLGNLDTIDRWQTILDSYKSAPYEIKKPFRICYDALEEEEKQVFLDIACFFNGKENDFLKELIKDDELDFPEDYIEVLIQKAFISLDHHNRIWMHNLLEQMGKQIARQEPLTEPGEHA
ncbi:TMV resistance protein N-like [Rosa chinensis]|uniref:TMV resistance protein N-like n=1 Tax=Rosa chinensis TaxID=74649 RepID=UPI000D086B65|nr:TMV resistance protein N-like [Rosa chinensis]